MRRTCAWCWPVLVCWLLAACGGQDAEPTAGDGGKDTWEIAVVPKGISHEFWKAVETGVRSAEQDLGNVTVTWKGPTPEDDLSGQISLLETFSTRGFDGICVAPVDFRGMARSVSALRKRGIPVVIFDSAVDIDDYQSFVATDNLLGGRLAGEHLARLVDGAGKVVLFRYKAGSASTEKRERGFLEAVAEHPGIEIMSDELESGSERAEGLRNAENLVLQVKDEMDAIFTPNELSTSVMIQALRSHGLYDKVVHVGFDASRDLLESLRAGEVKALVVQNPLKMGELCVRTMVAHLEGEAVEKRIDTGVELVTPGRLDEPEIRQMVGLPPR